MSIDPVTFMDTGNPGYFNRYAYTFNDPINNVDPDGRESSRVWTSSNSVNVVIPFTIIDPDGVASYTAADVKSQVESDFTGTTSVNGTLVDVTTTAVAFTPAQAAGYEALTGSVVNKVTANGSHTDANGNSRSGVVDGIGGSDVQMRSTAGANVVSHELGHSAGAGDQYAGGVGANSKVLSSSVPGTQGSVMRDLGGSANVASLNEIVNSGATNNVSCSAGASAANGDC